MASVSASEKTTFRRGILQRLLTAQEQRLLRLVRLPAFLHALRDPFQPLLHQFQIGKDKLDFNSGRVPQGVFFSQGVCHSRILERTHHVEDGVDIFDHVHYLPVPGRITPHQACLVDVLHCGVHHLPGAEDVSQGVNAGIRNLHRADVGRAFLRGVLRYGSILARKGVKNSCFA
jgi:hypothetical protein